MMSEHNTRRTLENWTLTTTRNVSDVYGLSGTVREWTHDTTGDTIEIRIDREGDFYGIHLNDSCDEAADTIRDAENIARWLADANPEGL